ncbi:TIR domain-containing protein, partial [Pseudomonas aeruginosa]
MGKHKVFISYHHANDQYYKNALEKMNEEHEIFVNRSVSLGDIDAVSYTHLRAHAR